MISRILTEVGLLAVKTYRIAISPYLAPACRHTPSCSAYAEESLKRYGIFKGGLMTAARLLRCNPFSRGGHDPVR